VTYAICSLSDDTRIVKAGAAIPVKVSLCDAGGANRSAPSIALHAVSVSLQSSNGTGPVLDAGHSNPGGDFRFDASLGTGGGYIFNLKTTGMLPGIYALRFTVSADPETHVVRFQVR
jgi:hypothetical protein